MFIVLVLEVHFHNHHVKLAEPAVSKHFNQMTISSLFYFLFSAYLNNTSCPEGRKYAKQVNVSLHSAYV